MVIKDGAKMSKSKGNVVSPDLMIERYGADATRMYALFAAPPDRDLEWQEDGVAGVSRFLSRVHRLSVKYSSVVPVRKSSGESGVAGKALLRLLHQTIGKITQDFEGRWHFNTCISSIMILVNEIAAQEPAMDSGEIEASVIATVFRGLSLLLAPFAPFLAAELWEVAGYEGPIFRQSWPIVDSELAREDSIEVPVQINGKLVLVIAVSAGLDEEAIKAAALAEVKVRTRLEGKTVMKTLVVKGKLLNFVVR